MIKGSRRGAQMGTQSFADNFIKNQSARLCGQLSVNLRENKKNNSICLNAI
jgi:hypothetical protein